MTDTVPERDLHRLLARWVAEKLIDPAQAARIEAAEKTYAATRGPQVSGRGDRAPLVVEALGYLGGALAVIAGFLAVNQLWPDIPVAAQLILAGVAAVVLGVVGAAIRTGGEPAFGRLRSVLWLMSTASAAAFWYLLGEQEWHLGPDGATVLAAAVTAGYAAALWWHTPAPLQHLALFVAAAVTVGSGIARLDPGAPDWASGLGVWALAALWLPAVRRGLLRPRTTGYLTASIGLLAGAVLTMEITAGRFLALGTVAALLIAGVLARRVWLLALGAIGVIIVVPETAVRYLPESAGAPLALLTVGLLLLAGAVWLARRGKRPTSG
jgi:predicted membrane protein DUF2157